MSSLKKLAIQSSKRYSHVAGRAARGFLKIALNQDNEQRRSRSTRRPCDLNRSGKRKTDTVKKLYKILQPRVENKAAKISVIGTGQVGIATVFTLLAQEVTTNVALVDINADKLKGELLDLRHGSSFLKNAKINASTDYAITAGSRICILTAGLRTRKGQTRLDLLQNNAEVLKKIIPQLVKYSPDAVFIIASNPVDVLSYMTWKISGLPHYKIIGSGTNLDSARFRYLLADRLGVATTSCHGFVIGEHGDSSVPVWSGVNIAGVRLQELNPAVGSDADPEKWQDIHTKVVQSAYQIVRLKGYTSWAISLTISNIAKAILTDANTVHPVSTYVKGEHGIEHEVFLSLPCVLGHNGVYNIVRQRLNEGERAMVHKSANIMAKVISSIKI